MVRKSGTENVCNLKESGNKFFLGRIAKKLRRLVGSAANCSGALSVILSIYFVNMIKRQNTDSAELTLLFLRAVNETVQRWR